MNTAARDQFAGADEGFLIDADAVIGQPPGMRIGANEQKHPTDLMRLVGAAVAVAPMDARHAVLVAFQSGDFGVRMHDDVGQGGDALDQVVRHAGGQAVAANDDVHARRVAV